MKKQTFLATLVDKTGETKDFYRFSCQRAETVEKKIREAASTGSTGLSSLYRTLWMQAGVVACEIWATPDGYHKEKEPVIRFPMDWAA